MSAKSFSIDHILQDSKASTGGRVSTATPPAQDHHKPPDPRQSAASQSAHLIELGRHWMIKTQYPASEIYDSTPAATAAADTSAASTWPFSGVPTAAPPAGHFWPPAIDLHWSHNRTAPVWHPDGHNWPLSVAYRHPLYLDAVAAVAAAAAAAAASSGPGAQCGTSVVRLVGGAEALPGPGRRQTRKGGQIRFTHEQSSELEKTFASQRYLTPGQRTLLASKLALTERQVKTWMQNRRAKWRRMRKEDGGVTELGGGQLEAKDVGRKLIDDEPSVDLLDDDGDDDQSTDEDLLGDSR